MNRYEVCAGCSARVGTFPLACALITKKPGKPCHRMLMDRIVGRDDTACPHPDVEQREKFAAAETLENQHQKQSQQKLKPIDVATRRAIAKSPHSRRSALANTPKITFKPVKSSMRRDGG